MKVVILVVLIAVLAGGCISQLGVEKLDYIGGKYDVYIVGKPFTLEPEKGFIKTLMDIIKLKSLQQKPPEYYYYEMRYTIGGKTYSGFYDETYRSSMLWIKTNTPENVDLLAWWDYGHMIRGMGERETIIYEPSKEILWTVANPKFITEFSPNEKVLDIANAITTTNEQETIDISKKYGANYIFITREEMSKASAIFNITGKDSKDYILPYYDTSGFTGYRVSEIGKQSMLYRLYTNTNTSFRLVYNDTIVIIYQIQ